MDLSLTLYLHSIKLSESNITFLRYYAKEMEYFLPAKHRLKSDLEKYGYVHQDKITSKGLELLEEIDNWDGVYEPKSRKKKDIVYSKEFLSFWSAFPQSDGYQDVIGTRELRKEKEKSFIQWELLMKEYTPQQIIKALEVEIAVRTQKSIKEGKNHLSFVSNTINYLKGRKFELYLGKEVPKDNTGKVTINKIAF